MSILNFIKMTSLILISSKIFKTKKPMNFFIGFFIKDNLFVMKTVLFSSFCLHIQAQSALATNIDE